VALWHEYHSKGSTYRQHRQRVFKASYTNQYRTGLIQIIEALEFGSTNTVHAPMMAALALIKQYRAEHTHRTKYYAISESLPVQHIVPGELAELMYRTDTGGRRRILRSVYECGVFQILRDKLRCKEIWVHDVYKWHNPDDDLPTDYEDKRAENYAQLRKSLDAKKFTAELIEEMDYERSALNDALPNLDWLQIVEREKGGAILLTPLNPLLKPRNLRKLKAAVRTRWGVVPLLDMFTETALRIKGHADLSGQRPDPHIQRSQEHQCRAEGPVIDTSTPLQGYPPHGVPDRVPSACWCSSEVERIRPTCPCRSRQRAAALHRGCPNRCRRPSPGQQNRDQGR
jgi:hypothetical protein